MGNVRSNVSGGLNIRGGFDSALRSTIYLPIVVVATWGEKGGVSCGIRRVGMVHPFVRFSL